MPLLPRLIVGVLLLLMGAVLVAVAVLGARGRLSRNPWVGVRTAATLRSDEAWLLAQRVGAAPTIAAGGVLALAGGVVLAGAAPVTSVVVAGIAGVAALLMAGYGGLVGHRAAERTVPAAPLACAGTCAGCDLVAGCRPAAVSEPGATPGA